jgi:hypothetical protein
MVGPPFDELSCFVVIELRTRRPVTASSVAGKRVTSTPCSSRTFHLVAMLTVNMPERGAGTALTNRTGMSRTISWSSATQLGHEEAHSLIPCFHKLNVDWDALMNEGMILAFKEAVEKRGVKLAHPARKRSSQERGTSCA